MSNKHVKTDTPTDADLKGNPGIGQSKGMTGSDIEAIEAVRHPHWRTRCGEPSLASKDCRFRSR